MKVAVVACFVLCLALAQGSSVHHKNDVAVYKMVLGNINNAFTHLKKEKSDCADCAISLTETIAYCILNFDTPEHIVTCVEDAIGTADLCYPCICEVLAWFDVIC